MVDTQSELIRRAWAGDVAALEALVAGQQRYVYSIALSVRKNPADAVNTTLEAFARMIRALGTYRQETTEAAGAARGRDAGTRRRADAERAVAGSPVLRLAPSGRRALRQARPLAAATIA